MTTTPANRLQLTVLGGFLGSGKTTWLRHQLHHGLLANALIVVNEAAAVAVDGAILARASRTTMLSGGCACCEGRADFLALLRRIADARTGGTQAGAEPPPDHVVVETSGLADPGALVEAIRSDPMLIHHIHVREIVVVVDGVNGFDQLASEPLSRAQVEAADRLVLTKTDAADPAALHRVVSVLAALNPGAGRTGTAMGSETPLPEPDPVLAATAGLAAADARPIVAARLELGPEPDWTDFAVWLSALLHVHGDEIVRVKGVVRTPAGRLLLQSVRRTVQPPELLPEPPTPAPEDNVVAVIGRGFSPEDLTRSLRRFTAAAAG